MAEILRNATVVDLDPASVEVTDLRIEGPKIVGRGAQLPAQPGDAETDLRGKVVMPGLVIAHAHLAFSLGRAAPSQDGKPGIETLDKSWSRVDRALDVPTVELASAAGALEALFAGTTTVFDHHSSPSCIGGSLDAVRRGVDQVGIRAVLSYASSDRAGKGAGEAAVAENERYLQALQDAPHARHRAMVGLHDSENIDDATLEQLVALAKRFGVGLQFHAAETLSDDRDAQKRFQKSLAQRLADAGVCSPGSVVAHGTCFAWEDLAVFLQFGTWMCHLPRANMLSGHGHAPVKMMGPRMVLGTENLAPDLFGELRAAIQRGADAGVAIDPLRVLSAGHKLASQAFGITIGPMREGAAADLLVLDYEPRQPLTAQSLGQHLAAEISARDVEAVMVDGCWRLWGRTPLKADPREIGVKGSRAAAALWETMAGL